MKSFILLVAIVSLWMAVTAAPRGNVEGTKVLDGQLPEETDGYDASELPKEVSRQNKLTDRGDKGKLF